MPRSGSWALAVALSAALAASASTTAQPDAAASLDRQTTAAVAVTGTSTLVGEDSPGKSTFDDDVVRIRDNILVTAEVSTDPRVSGRATITVNIDAYPDAAGRPGATQVRFGRMELANEGGTWTGSFAGSLANGGFVQTYWLEGAGDYEGLSYIVTAGGNGPVWRSQGLIFPGELPPLGTGPRLPIEGQDIDLPTAGFGGIVRQPLIPPQADRAAATMR
jgi:hypothetical protein